MATFKQRKGKWVIRFYDSSRSPKEKRESFSLDKDKKEIKKLEHKMNLAYEEDWDPWLQSWKDYQLGNDPDAITLNEAIDMYFTRKTISRAWSKKTEDNYRKFFDHFKQFIGPNMPITHVDEARVLGYLNRDLSSSTYDTYLTYIKSFMNWLRDQGIQVPRISIDYLNEDKERKFVTPEQLKAIQSCYRSKDYRKNPNKIGNSKFHQYDAAFGLMFYMCLRVSEALKLRRKDFDRKNIMLRRKGGKKEWRFLMPEANNFFMELYNNTSGPEDRLIPIGYGAIRDTWKVVRKHALGAQSQDLTLHHLRHGGAMYYLHNFDEIDREWLKHFLSHEKYETTGIYAEMTQDLSRSVVERAYNNRANKYPTGPQNNSGSGSSETGFREAAGE